MSETSSTESSHHQSLHAPDNTHLTHQVFLLEDTVMTLSMAVTTISRALARWERVILPMMLGFILLAAYGFYLIFNLVYDIGMISNNVAQMTMTVDRNMGAITDELKDMKKDVAQMSGSVHGMHQEMIKITHEISQMNKSIQQVGTYVGHIDYSAEKMSGDLWDLNRNISGPMSTMNNVMPWRMMGGRSESTPPKNYYLPQQNPYINPQMYTPPPIGLTPNVLHMPQQE
jgi:hypothetical protein